MEGRDSSWEVSDGEGCEAAMKSRNAPIWFTIHIYESQC